MDNIYILQNEIDNALDRLTVELKATDDERILALQLSLATAYKVKNTRVAYASKLTNTEKEKYETTT